VIERERRIADRLRSRVSAVLDPVARNAPAEILTAAREIQPWLTEVRRTLHRHPELGLEEHRTSRFVRDWLDQLGIEHADGLGGTGVLGLIPGKEGGPVVALRADLDALPIEEENEVPYRSLFPGKMHACGHDAHTAILLGAGRILSRFAGELPGTVKLLFQPAEETVGGAELLIEAGVMEKPKVDAVFGLHVEPDLEVGKIGVRYGQRNAASDDVRISLLGRSGHGAYPAGGVDAVVMAAQVVTALQSVVSRNVDARQSAVVSIGIIRGGAAGNVMASRVELVGTVRTLDPRIRETVLQRVKGVAEGVAAGMGGRAEVEFEPGYVALINDTAMVDVVRVAGEAVLGEENVVIYRQPNMGVEDFAYYLKHAPGAFYSLGVRNEEKGIVHSVHHERFDLDEDCLPIGAAIQALNALTVLAGPQ
jgi:amidohydrolase